MTDEEQIRREGTPWWSRLEHAVASHPQPRDSPLLDPHRQADVQRWRAAVDPQDAGLFERRLAWDGLTPASAGRVLDLPLLDPEPAWSSDLGEIMAGAQAAGTTPRSVTTDGAFADVLRPMIDWSWAELRGELAPEALAALLPEARRGLQDGLLARLTETCDQALDASFRARRTRGENLMLDLGAIPDSTAGRNRYDQWHQDVLRSGYVEVLRPFPVLGRLIAQLCRQWVDATRELLTRLSADRAVLADAFAVATTTPIAAIQPGLSDPHRGGRSVAVLTFGSGPDHQRLVYKPKDVRIEQQYHRLAARIASWVQPAAATPVRVLARHGYGYVSFVEATPCTVTAELAAFYRSAGRLLATLHLLGATDAHYDNLIATKTDLVLVDAETLFQGRTLGTGSDVSTAPGGDRPFAESVVRVGMLPGWRLTGPHQQVFDGSALGIDAPQVPTTREAWLDTGTDHLRRGRLTAPSSAPASLPVRPPTRNPLVDHVEDLVRGFTDTYRAAMMPARRQELLTLLDGFDGAWRRVVLRATKVYGSVQRRALSAEALSSANLRGAELELLSRSALVSGRRSPLWEVFRAEIRDMETLDVPYFDHALGSPVVRGATGPIEGVLLTDGLAEARARVRALSEVDLSWQVRLIRMSVRARYALLSRSGARRTASPAPENPAPTGDACVVVSDVLSGIERSAIRTSENTRGRPTWVTFSLLPDGEHVQLGPLGPGLYDGRLGIASFVALARRIGVAGSMPDLDAELLAPVLAAVQPEHPYDRYRYLRDLGLGFAGVGGLLRGLRQLAPAAATALIAGIDHGLVERDDRLDFMGGCAGLVAPLARHLRVTDDDHARALLTAAARRLADAQLPGGGWPSPLGEHPLTGLSHGAAGNGLALLLAGDALDDPDLTAAGARAFAYEDGVFDDDAGNWPDFRAAGGSQRAAMVAWCHGAPGIGLARLQALRLLPNHRDSPMWQRDLDVAMAASAQAPLADTDHLCCGTSGRAAILRIAGHRCDRRDWLAAADRLTTSLLARYHADGRFRLPLDDPHLAESSPGLLTGTSGIGAHLATRLTTDDLAGLLL